MRELKWYGQSWLVVFIIATWLDFINAPIDRMTTVTLVIVVTLIAIPVYLMYRYLWTLFLQRWE